jgi:hypothetical protein
LASGTILDFTYTVDPATATAKKVALPTYSFVPATCAAQTTLAVKWVDGTTEKTTLPAFAKLTASEFEVNSSDVSLSGTYVFKMIATEPKSSKTNEFTFKVTIACTVTKIAVAKKNVADQTYTIKSPVVPAEIDIPTYSFTPSACVKDLALKLEVVSRPDKLTTFPAFITQAPSNKAGSKITVQTSDLSIVGNYVFKIVATEPISNVSNNEITFKLTIACTITKIAVV